MSRRHPKRRRPRPSYWDRDPGLVLEESEPWLETMVAVDEAERRGGAKDTLRLMSGRALGPDNPPRRYDEYPIHDLLYVAVARRLGEVLLTADRRLVDRLRDPVVRVVG